MIKQVQVRHSLQSAVWEPTWFALVLVLLILQITIVAIVSTILLIVVVIGISVGVHNANVDKKLALLSKKTIA